MKRIVLNMVLVGVLMAVATGPLVLAQDGGTVRTGAELNVRSGPGLEFPLVGVLPQETVVVPDGRNGAGNWILIHTPDGSVEGWVAAGYLRGLNVTALTIVTGEVPVPPAAGGVPEGDTARTRVALNVRTGPGLGYERITTLSYNTTVIVDQQSGAWSHIRTPNGTITGWVATEYLVFGTPAPIIPGGTPASTSLTGGVLGKARTTYARGQNRGNRANAFIRVGDSNSAGTAFLCPFNYGNYDLAGHVYLQDTINFFNQTGSFCANDATARNGFSTFSILDPLSADQGICTLGETPLECAVRTRQPSVAIIYLGLSDMATLTRGEFRTNMNQIVTQFVNLGVIPVLNTFPISDQLAFLYDPEFNAIIRQIAVQQQVPLLDLQQMTLNYPNQGTGPDGYHLSYEQYDFMSFAEPAVETYGRNLRELVTLQMLDEIMHNVMGG